MNFIIVPVMLISSMFLISVSAYCVKALFISRATWIVRAWGAIWLNPLATVLFKVCSSVTVECCVLTSGAWVSLVCFCYVTKKLLRRGYDPV